MKKLIVIAVLMVFAMSAVVAFADTTSRGSYTTPIAPLTNWLNSNDDFYHGHEYTDNQYEKGVEVGLGLDVTVYEFDGVAQEWGADSIEIQQKYDINNGEYAVYGVVQVNAWKVIKNLMNR